MKKALSGYPILSCRETAELEAAILNNEAAEWLAMNQAGCGIAKALYRDYQELSSLPETFNLLALVGKGNNGGDALIACRQILEDFPGSRVTLLLTADPDELKPLALRAFTLIKEYTAHYTIQTNADATAIHAILDQEAGDQGFDLCIDGLLGMSFRPPVREPVGVLIKTVNSFDRIHLRAAVDLPSGKGDTSDTLFFRADFTYATGIPKQALFNEKVDCGRIRVIDLGFHETAECAAFDPKDKILLPESALQPLRSLRPANANKYTYGHVFIIGGSACMPGALLMSVQAAVRSGVGLVTAFAPSSVSASLAAQVPEAMWVPWPETDEGTLKPEAIQLLLERIDRATAVLTGPGMGKGESTEWLVQEIIEKVELPTVMDADALSHDVIRHISKKRRSGSGPVILTPHTGEFVRMAKLRKEDVSNKTLRAFCQEFNVTTILKGPLTRICNKDTVRYSVHGSPVLSRGGSGDILAGLIGGMIAQQHLGVGVAVECAVTLHGLAAERLAREKGQVCVHTIQLLDCLAGVLR